MLSENHNTCYNTWKVLEFQCSTSSHSNLTIIDLKSPLQPSFVTVGQQALVNLMFSPPYKKNTILLQITNP